MHDYEKAAKQFEAACAAALERSAPLASDLMKWFCENWDTVKKVLQAIGDAIGGIAKIIIDLAIRAGQAYWNRHCKKPV